VWTVSQSGWVIIVFPLFYSINLRRWWHISGDGNVSVFVRRDLSIPIVYAQHHGLVHYIALRITNLH
jgi:hypothetical protein